MKHATIEYLKVCMFALLLEGSKASLKVPLGIRLPINEHFRISATQWALEIIFEVTWCLISCLRSGAAFYFSFRRSAFKRVVIWSILRFCWWHLPQHFLGNMIVRFFGMLTLQVWWFSVQKLLGAAQCPQIWGSVVASLAEADVSRCVKHRAMPKISPHAITSQTIAQTNPRNPRTWAWWFL